MGKRNTFAAHISARIRGMKSELMPRHELDAMLDKGDADALADVLLGSPYEDAIAESLTRWQGVDAVEDAVARDLIRTFAKLKGMCFDDYTILAEIFIERWDLIAVKSLLRARFHELDVESAKAAIMPSPSMPAALAAELAGEGSIEALVARLAAWNPRLCGRMVQRLGAFNESRKLSVLEEALDYAYFADNVVRLNDARDADKTFLRDLLRMEIDRINLRILFEPRGTGADLGEIQSRLLPNGSLPPAVIQEILSAQSPERAAEALAGTKYAALAEGLEDFAQTGRYSRLERLFEVAFIEKLRRASFEHPMGLPILMRYAWLKYNEVLNIRTIARGLAAKLPRTVLEQEVLYV